MAHMEDLGLVDEENEEERQVLLHWDIPDQVEVTDAQVAAVNVGGHVVLSKFVISQIASCAQESEKVRNNWKAMAVLLEPLYSGRDGFATEKPRFEKICMLGYSAKDNEIFYTVFPPNRSEWSVRTHLCQSYTAFPLGRV